jgi:thiamine biosynthesis protein ThiI
MVVDLAKKSIGHIQGQLKTDVVNFTDITTLYLRELSHDELTIIMRRVHDENCGTFCKRTGGCLGLITGESIGQVASQTMKSLLATK